MLGCYDAWANWYESFSMILKQFKSQVIMHWWYTATSKRKKRKPREKFSTGQPENKHEIHKSWELWQAPKAKQNGPCWPRSVETPLIRTPWYGKESRGSRNRESWPWLNMLLGQWRNSNKWLWVDHADAMDKVADVQSGWFDSFRGIFCWTRMWIWMVQTPCYGICGRKTWRAKDRSHFRCRFSPITAALTP